MFYFYDVKVVKKRDIRKVFGEKILKKCSATDYLTLPNFCSVSTLPASSHGTSLLPRR